MPDIQDVWIVTPVKDFVDPEWISKKPAILEGCTSVKLLTMKTINRKKGGRNTDKTKEIL